MSDVALYSPRVLSLCTGYGGLELGLGLVFERARAVCYVERDVYAAANLVARFNDTTLHQAPIWDDVTTFDGRPWRGKVDFVLGGYPCVGFSVAGKKKGLKDHRNLWPAFARIVRDVRPHVCFFENVSNHLNLGFFEVSGELQGLGYEVAATLVTAAEVGAPQERERLFILGVLSDAERNTVRDQPERGQSDSPERRDTESAHDGKELANGNSDGFCTEQIATTEDGNPPSRHDTHRRRDELADPDRKIRRDELQPGKPGKSRRTGSQGGRAELGHTHGQGREGGISWKPENYGPYKSGWLFPPGKNDYERWGQLLRDHPEVYPAVESEIRKPPHGHPYWTDECRCNGNGVVPLQAAYALSTLLIDTGLISAGYLLDCMEKIVEGGSDE